MSALAILAGVLAATFAACCVLLAAFIGSLLYMVVLHHRLKSGGLARERALLATPLPPDSELPHVVVQIPSGPQMTTKYATIWHRGADGSWRLAVDSSSPSPPRLS